MISVSSFLLGVLGGKVFVTTDKDTMPRAARNCAGRGRRYTPAGEQGEEAHEQIIHQLGQMQIQLARVEDNLLRPRA